MNGDSFVLRYIVLVATINPNNELAEESRLLYPVEFILQRDSQMTHR
jgi:hypothetical protein